jgi:predicted DNA binding CopG/RHH family protein
MERDMDRIIFRCPPALLSEIKARAAAAGVSVGIYVRQLLEKHTGIAEPVGVGLAGTDAKTLQRVQNSAIKAIKRKARERRKAEA